MNSNQKKLRIGVVVVALLAGGISVWFFKSGFEDTDNAYTAAHVASLSTKVPGLVTEVLVEENYKVKKDQVLVRIDARDYQNTVDNLRAQLSAVEASLALAKKDFGRSAHLFSQHVITEQAKDRDSTKFQELQDREEGIKALLTEAELNLSFTEIRAPADGTVGKKGVEAGMVVSPGQALLSFVDAQSPWIVANFKETQLRKMKIGQECEVEIDSIGGKVFKGVVESFSPGTGATFALIPPDNASGNFTKIVQRLPVRVRFAADSIRGFEDRIVPGLSAEVKVRLGSGEKVGHSEIKISEK
jgi:membrane fusion protein (multidrug efflux system)